MKKEKGVSLIEIILVVAAVGILILLVASLPQSITSIRKSNNTSLAKEIAARELDLLRRQPYQSFIKGTFNFSDVNLLKLSSASASYEIADCPTEICTQNEDAKRIKVDINWFEGKDIKNVELLTIVAEGGL